MKSSLGRINVAVLATILLLACSGWAQERSSAADSLLIKGENKSITFSLSDFHSLPHVALTVHNSHTDATENYSGARLAELLSKVNAPLGKELRGKAMTSYVVATGSDGYAVVLSLAEVDPEFHSGEIIVADQQHGHPLGKDGPFRLIVSEDKRPARWVHNLVSITLKGSE
jgi:hypothetical protein